MNSVVDRLAIVASELAPAQQEVLLQIAGDLARKDRFFDTMDSAQLAALDEAIAEADAGGGVSRVDLDARLDELFAHHGA